ncbi:hypothetical protein ACS0TY_011712 [Phlomoides rotata]
MDILQQYFFQDDNIPTRESNPKTIYRDIELEKKKKKVHFETQKNSEPAGNVSRDFVDYLGRGKSGTQLKILMTKEEAHRLLSKCQDGGVLDFKDVANELVQIPSNRVSLRIDHTDTADADVASTKKHR